jgi:hypothetical protein
MFECSKRIDREFTRFDGQYGLDLTDPRAKGNGDPLLAIDLAGIETA